jgi:hypothetical protein
MRRFAHGYQRDAGEPSTILSQSSAHIVATAEIASSSVFQKKYQLRGNNAAWAGPFYLLRGVSAQLRGNVASFAKELHKSRT